jgi:hypothetical protein
MRWLALGTYLTRLFASLAVLLIFIASQIFWVRRVGQWGAGLLPNKAWRKALAGVGLAVYTILFAYNFGWTEWGPSPVHMTLKAALLEAPQRWWVVSSVLGFIVIVPFAVGAYITAAYWFTSSTSFANPAVTVARALTDTFAGIGRPDAPGFIAAEVAAIPVALFLFSWFFPSRGR